MVVDQSKLKEWSEEALEMYLNQVRQVGEDVATSFYNQSDLSRVKECELMILGINPGCGCRFSQWEKKDLVLHDNDFLYKGNPCFEGKNDEEIIFELSKKHYKEKRRYGWDLWKKIHKLLKNSGKGYLLEELDKFVLSNMVFFGTAHQNQIPKEIDQEKCASKTLELIDILVPKVVLLLGIECKSLFETVSKQKMIEIEAKNLSYCKRDDSIVFAIKHTAHFYSNAKLEEISPIICSALDSSKDFEKTINIVPLMQLINSQDSIQRIDSNGTIVYTYWCNKNGKYKEENGTISIGLEYDKDNNYVLSIRTEGNHPKKLQALVNDYCYDSGLFKRDDCSNTKYIANAKVEVTEVAKYIDGLLSKIKTYREKDYQE